jgi:hypothetical protein
MVWLGLVAVIGVGFAFVKVRRNRKTSAAAQ